MNVNDPREEILDQVEIRDKALALRVSGVAIQAHAHTALGDTIHDDSQRGQFSGRAVGLERHFLAQVGGEDAQFIHGPCDLVDGLFARDVTMKLVGEHSQDVAAHVVAELQMRFGRLNGCPEFVRLRPVHTLATGDAHDMHGTVGESLLDFGTLGRTECQLDAMRVIRAGSQFDTVHTGLTAVGDQRGDVPILPPRVCRQAEPHFRLGRWLGRPQRRWSQPAQ